jgi:hypothetical protein
VKVVKDSTRTCFSDAPEWEAVRRWMLPTEFNHSDAEWFCLMDSFMRPNHARWQLLLGYDYAQEQHRPDSPRESIVAASSGAKEWT